MSLSVRKRGSVWHARGTIRVGRETVAVPEFSTGQSSRAGALDVATKEARRITEDALDGSAGRARRLTLDDCFEVYLRRPGGLRPYDVARIGALSETIGHMPLAEAPAAWQAWMRSRPVSHPATMQRWRTTLLAALRMACSAHGLPPPTLPGVKQDRQVREAYLSDQERERLLAAYPLHAGRVALALAYQGLRTQEALRLDWRNVDFTRETLHVRSDRAKSGKGRSLPIHGRVLEMLRGLWAESGQPSIGPVFLNRRGKPYADTRDTGGNPLKKQHAAACAAARVTGFRVHDWRHDWASRHVMAGTDLYTLMRLGGWASLKMVERYSAVSTEHMRSAVQRFA